MKSLNHIVLILCILVVLLPAISKPFNGHHEFNGVFYGQIAKNYLRYGVLETRGAQVASAGDIPQALWGLHTHHPATYPLLLALSFKLFDISEGTARDLSILSTILGFLLLSRLISLVTHSSFYSNLLLTSLVLTPLVRYYGRLPVFEPLLLPLVAGILPSYHHKKPFLLFAFSLFAILLDWPGYWPAISVIILDSVRHRRITKATTMAIASIACGTILIVLHQWLAVGNPIKAFADVGLLRLGTNNQPYTTTEWLRLLVSRTKAFYGLPLLITGGIGTLISLKQKKLRSYLFLTGFIGFAHILMFRNITWYHDYMLYHTLPFVALTTAIFTHWLVHKYSSRLLHTTYFILLILGTYFLTNPFYTALSTVTPHQMCIDIARGANPEVSEQKKAECPPFITFYADRTIPLTIAPDSE